MNTDFLSDYRKIGDVSYEFWISELQKVDSPLLPWSRQMYDVLKGFTALGLAQMWRECQYESDRKLLSWRDFNPWNMKQWPEDARGMKGIGAVGTKPTGVGGPDYLCFDSPVSAASEYRRRIFDDDTYKAGIYTRQTTLAQFVQTFAPDYEVHPVTGVNNSSYYRDMVAILTRFAANDIIQEVAPMATKLHVILIAGHNSVGDGGNPVERALTPKLAAAYLATFRAAGISVEWINPTMFAGGLDGLASATARAIRNADADLVLALDLHFNGAKSGVHTIVAHNRNGSGDMLRTAIVAGRVAADVAENNTLDMRLAEAISKAIVAAVPGMYLWDADGIMLESQSGVGLDNYRLAMMAYSAPHRMKSVRLTIEHGGTNDAGRPDFAAKCAAAVLGAVRVVLADRLESGQPAPDPNPDPVPEGDPGDPALPAFLFGSVQGYSFNPNGPVSKLWLKTCNERHAWPRLVDVLERDGLRWFVFADGSVITTDLKGQGPTYLYDTLAA